ncbi:hypothetical protein Bca52824_018675 [Brassica carinata]|uniref:RNase H type-1 domain-containing protein n=1 Tax=Brassica carinata TaxID=52824 RepID=A0A8X7VR01_BRACI|nr:hypothetical protein Bca52824_018675 [Brassica carinata]
MISHISLSFSSAMRFVGSPLIALREAILKFKQLGLTSVRCESDCDQLVKALTSDFPLAAIYSIVSDIKAIALSFDVCSFSWISREKNCELRQILWQNKPCWLRLP